MNTGLNYRDASHHFEHPTPKTPSQNTKKITKGKEEERNTMMKHLFHHNTLDFFARETK